MSRKRLLEVPPSEIHKILLIRLRRIGDIIMTTPAVTALKKAVPESQITYVVEEPYRCLVDGLPGVDRVIALGKRSKLPVFWRLLRTLHNEPYDVMFDFHGGPRAWWMALAAKAKIKVGYEIKYRGFVYDIAIPRGIKNGFVHSVENHLNLVRALGFRVERPPLSLPPAQESEIRKVDRLFAENGLEGSKLIVLHISAGNQFRDWGVDNWTGLVDRLAQEPSVRVVLVGGEPDHAAEQRILSLSSSHPVSFVGRLNLLELKEMMARSSLFVGPDSGPMHIAAATGTPIVALFGPTLPVHFSPWQAKAYIVAKELSCRPCRQKKCLTADFRCLRSITPEEVLHACRRFV